MKYVFFLLLLFISSHLFAQKLKLDENSVVKDSFGTVYPSSLWQPLLMRGTHIVKPENAADANTAFFLVRLTDEERDARLAKMPKPVESAYFKTGQKFGGLKATDINGNKINSKDLAGKILVLNYWFINCPPCRAEMPELNAMVDSFQHNDKVVFVAVALDDASSIKEFLNLHAFKYRIVDDGRYYANEYRINSYPTHVVIDTEGKVYFHTSGLATNTVHWIKKSIEEILAKPDKSIAAQ